MNVIMRLAAAVAIFAGISVFSNYTESVAHQSAIDTYRLKPEMVVVMDACADSMKRHSRKFKAGAARMTGCACMAKHIAEEFEPEEFHGVNAIIDLTMRMSAAKEGALGTHASMLRGLNGKLFADWTDSRKMTLLRVMGESLGACSKPDAQV